jgi:hypothetical protein
MRIAQPFFFVSASDGTNVVKIFNMAIKSAIQWKAAPKEDFLQEVCVCGGGGAGVMAGSDESMHQGIAYSLCMQGKAWHAC